MAAKRGALIWNALLVRLRLAKIFLNYSRCTNGLGVVALAWEKKRKKEKKKENKIAFCLVPVTGLPC